jgi:hypothetical protein
MVCDVESEPWPKTQRSQGSPKREMEEPEMVASTHDPCKPNPPQSRRPPARPEYICLLCHQAAHWLCHFEPVNGHRGSVTGYGLCRRCRAAPDWALRAEHYIAVEVAKVEQRACSN